MNCQQGGINDSCYFCKSRGNHKLVISGFFWIMLACFEVVGFVGQWILLGNSIRVLIDDFHVFAAISFYALLCLPTAIVYWTVEKSLSGRFPKIKKMFGCMDAFLFLGWGLLAFKITAIILMNVVSEEHIPKVPYLLILPFMLLYIIVVRFVGVNQKNSSQLCCGVILLKYYFIQWLVLAIGTVFVSKGAYDLIFASSRHVFIRIILYVLFSAVAVGSAAVFNAVLNKILTRRHKYRSREVLISQCVFFLAGFFMVLLILRLTVLNDYFSLPSKRATIVKNQELKVD